MEKNKFSDVLDENVVAGRIGWEKRLKDMKQKLHELQIDERFFDNPSFEYILVEDVLMGCLIDTYGNYVQSGQGENLIWNQLMSIGGISNGNDLNINLDVSKVNDTSFMVGVGGNFYAHNQDGTLDLVDYGFVYNISYNEEDEIVVNMSRVEKVGRQLNNQNRVTDKYNYVRGINKYDKYGIRTLSEYKHIVTDYTDPLFVTSSGYTHGLRDNIINDKFVVNHSFDGFDSFYQKIERTGFDIANLLVIERKNGEYKTFNDFIQLPNYSNCLRYTILPTETQNLLDVLDHNEMSALSMSDIENIIAQEKNPKVAEGLRSRIGNRDKMPAYDSRYDLNSKFNNPFCLYSYENTEEKGKTNMKSLGFSTNEIFPIILFATSGLLLLFGLLIKFIN